MENQTKKQHAENLKATIADLAQQISANNATINELVKPASLTDRDFTKLAEIYWSMDCAIEDQITMLEKLG